MCRKKLQESHQHPVAEKPASPNLNGKVERSHLTDKLEFYRLLEYTGDVDLRKKLVVWEEFYNVHRPHGGLAGRTPYKELREKMASCSAATELGALTTHAAPIAAFTVGSG